MIRISVSEISSPRSSSVHECQSVECAFTSPVIIGLGMLVLYCMQFVMSVSVVSMVSWCGGVSRCYAYVGYGDVLEKVFCVYFEKLYFCVVGVDDLWRVDVCECCVRFNVGDEAATLFVFSVCADGNEVWYLWCPGCGGEF